MLNKNLYINPICAPSWGMAHWQGEGPMVVFARQKKRSILLGSATVEREHSGRCHLLCCLLLIESTKIGSHDLGYARHCKADSDGVWPPTHEVSLVKIHDDWNDRTLCHLHSFIYVFCLIMTYLKNLLCIGGAPPGNCIGIYIYWNP